MKVVLANRFFEALKEAGIVVPDNCSKVTIVAEVGQAATITWETWADERSLAAPQIFKT